MQLQNKTYSYRQLQLLSSKRLLEVIAEGGMDKHQAIEAAQIAEKRFPSLLQTKEVVKLVNLSQKKIYKHVQNGTIPYFQIGNEYRFSMSELRTHFLIKDQESKIA